MSTLVAVVFDDETTAFDMRNALVRRQGATRHVAENADEEREPLVIGHLLLGLPSPHVSFRFL